MSETIYNTGNHLKTGEWVIFGICRKCGERYIVQTHNKPVYCPVCGNELGKLHIVEENEE